VSLARLQRGEGCRIGKGYRQLPLQLPIVGRGQPVKLFVNADSARSKLRTENNITPSEIYCTLARSESSRRTLRLQLHGNYSRCRCEASIPESNVSPSRVKSASTAAIRGTRSRGGGVLARKVRYANNVHYILLSFSSSSSFFPFYSERRSKRISPTRARQYSLA